VEGLGLLDVETELDADKSLLSVEGTLCRSGAAFKGYEMHVGKTRGPDTARPFVTLSDGRRDSATSPDGRVAGCYVHGLFASDAARSAFLSEFGVESLDENYEAVIDDILDRFAEHLARHVDIERLLTLAK
jgi:adenosylcobyric acid synthase